MAFDRIDEANLKYLEGAASSYWQLPRITDDINAALNALGVGVKRPEVWLDGTWDSQYTYKNLDDPTGPDIVESGEVKITQSGLSIQGKAIAGNYLYEFAGRIENHDVIGEWKGKLMGTFQLRFNIENRNALDGYWIGTGAKGLYNGSWNLVRK